jgi:hypothetical protein
MRTPVNQAERQRTATQTATLRMQTIFPLQDGILTSEQCGSCRDMPPSVLCQADCQLGNPTDRGPLTALTWAPGPPLMTIVGLTTPGLMARQMAHSLIHLSLIRSPHAPSSRPLSRSVVRPRSGHLSVGRLRLDEHAARRRAAR